VELEVVVVLDDGDAPLARQRQELERRPAASITVVDTGGAA